MGIDFSFGFGFFDLIWKVVVDNDVISCFFICQILVLQVVSF